MPLANFVYPANEMMDYTQSSAYSVTHKVFNFINSCFYSSIMIYHILAQEKQSQNIRKVSKELSKWLLEI